MRVGHLNGYGVPNFPLIMQEGMHGLVHPSEGENYKTEIGRLTWTFGILRHCGLFHTSRNPPSLPTDGCASESVRGHA